MSIRIETVPVVSTSGTQQAVQLLIGDSLAAILTRLTFADQEGTSPPNTWYVEFGFGPFAVDMAGRMFANLDDVRDWAETLEPPPNRRVS